MGGEDRGIRTLFVDGSLFLMEHGLECGMNRRDLNMIIPFSG